MGLIKAGMSALGGTFADQWKEFFYCDALDKDVLMVKGQKRTSRRSSNHGEDNIITNGSGIAVADGQCMLIVEQGKVVEVCAEPGEYTFDSSTEPSVFTGNFGDSLAATFQTVAKRFTYGGDTGKDQRVYYINTKELGGLELLSQGLAQNEEAAHLHAAAGTARTGTNEHEHDQDLLGEGRPQVKIAAGETGSGDAGI